MNSIITAWISSLQQYLQMSVFLSSPARLPSSPPAILLTLIAYIIVGEIMLGEERTLISIVMQIAIEVLILLFISFIFLKLTNKLPRLLQTMSALIGVGLVISLSSLLIMSVITNSNDTEQVNPVVIQINFLLLFWNLAAISLIFKRAFEIRTITAGFIALNYFIFYEFLLVNFF